MDLSRASLGLKLNLALAFFFVVLGAATAVLILYGFNETQHNATSRSQDALEEVGELALLNVIAGQAAYGSLAFDGAADIGNRAARFLSSFEAAGDDANADVSGLAKTPEGLTYDADPDRISDLVVPNFVEVNDAVLEEIAYTASLDSIFPALFETYAGSVREANFDPIAIAFIGANATVRYYPRVELHEFIPADLDVTTLEQRLGPSGNPERKTLWQAPYEDDAGKGFVMTVEVPAYDGDVYRGTFQVDLSLARLIQQVDVLKLTSVGFAFYVDARGDLLESESKPQILSEIEGGNVDLISTLEAMRNREQGVRRATIGGEEMFIGYSPMDGVGGSLGLAASVEEITASAAAITAGIDEKGQQTLRVTLLAMGCLFVVGLIGATYLNRRVLMRPIEALAAATRAVAQGDFDSRINVKGSDELSDLGHSFNQMTSDIQREVQEREAAQSELSALFAAMTDAVVVVNREGRYVRVPRTNAPPLLMPPEDLPGKLMREVMPPGQAEVFIAHVGQALETQETRVFEYPLTIGDATYWFSAAVSPISHDEVVVVARDITERVNARQELEREVEERTRELSMLLTVSRNVASTLELKPLLALVIEEVRAIADYRRGSVLTVEGDNFSLLDTHSDFGDTATSLQFPMSMLEPVSSRLLRGESVLIPDVRGDTSEAEAYRRVTSQLFTTGYDDIHSWMVVPLALKDRVIGLLSLAHSEPGFYSEHQARLVAAVATQVAVAIENARLYEQAQQLATIEERQRLARELHDSVSQALYGIALGAKTARTLLDTDPARAIEPTDYVLQLADAGLAEMRALIFELRPESLETEGLVAALEKQIAATRARYGIQVEAQLAEEPAMSLAQKEVFYRVGQEALHNIVKHAHATRVDVTVATEDDGSVRLEVRDNGVGFDAGGSFPGHMGLVSITERAASIDATVSVESTPGAGTTVRLLLRP